MSRKKNAQRRRWDNWIRLPGNRERLQKLYDRQKGKCAYCNRVVPYFPGKAVNYKEHGNHATFDHEVPLAKGGGVGMLNIVMACWECNQERNNEDNNYQEYLRKERYMSILTHPKIDIETNWNQLKTELLSTGKDGMDKFIEFLEQRTDFKTAPASTKFHMNYKGGLCEHTLNVSRYIALLTADMEVPGVDVKSAILVALLHDLCKVNYYVEGEEWDKEWKDQTNQWRKKPVWKVEDKAPLGHGEKSVILAVRYLPLTLDEMCAIRWHMGFSDGGVHSYYPSGAPFKDSMDKYPLLKLLMLADAQAELYESYAYKE